VALLISEERVDELYPINRSRAFMSSVYSVVRLASRHAPKDHAVPVRQAVTAAQIEGLIQNGRRRQHRKQMAKHLDVVEELVAGELALIVPAAVAEPTLPELARAERSLGRRLLEGNCWALACLTGSCRSSE
jgi:hypothetical protein